MKGKSEAEVAQSCQTLSDPMDCSPPGSSVHGIFPGKSTGVPLPSPNNRLEAPKGLLSRVIGPKVLLLFKLENENQDTLES